MFLCLSSTSSCRLTTSCDLTTFFRRLFMAFGFPPSFFPTTLHLHIPQPACFIFEFLFFSLFKYTMNAFNAVRNTTKNKVEIYMIFETEKGNTKEVVNFSKQLISNINVTGCLKLQTSSNLSLERFVTSKTSKSLLVFK